MLKKPSIIWAPISNGTQISIIFAVGRDATNNRILGTDNSPRVHHSGSQESEEEPPCDALQCNAKRGFRTMAKR